MVEEAEVGQDGAVRGLRTRDGRTLSFDLYVDATGFRSLLLGKALGVPFRSYDASLRTDAAIAADVPNEGPIAPYTLAETMNAGWCWSIPQLDSDHRGYVFATSHLSADAAEAEMRAKNPGMGAARLVRFRSGRLERCWVGNVVGVGNAYAFVEPLESTALHMLVHQVRMLLDALDGPGDDAARARMNDAVGAHWDTLRGFLALHYRFNRRLDTPFWRDSERVDLASGEAMLAAFREGAPLVARPDRSGRSRTRSSAPASSGYARRRQRRPAARAARTGAHASAVAVACSRLRALGAGRARHPRARDAAARGAGGVSRDARPLWTVGTSGRHLFRGDDLEPPGAGRKPSRPERLQIVVAEGPDLHGAVRPAHEVSEGASSRKRAATQPSAWRSSAERFAGEPCTVRLVNAMPHPARKGSETAPGGRSSSDSP